MHIVHPFILRLFIETEEPERIRGALQNISDQTSIPFSDGQALLEILQHLIETFPDSQPEDRSSVTNLKGDLQ